VADVLVDTDVLVDHPGSHRVEGGPTSAALLVITRAELVAGSSACDAVVQLLGPIRAEVVDERRLHVATRNTRHFGR
jgi:hypothetical protein